MTFGFDANAFGSSALPVLLPGITLNITNGQGCYRAGADEPNYRQLETSGHCIGLSN
jgi:hypothetical protein